MKPLSFSLPAFAMLVLLAGCGKATYEARLEETVGVLRHQQTLQQELGPRWRDDRTGIALRPPQPMQKLQEAQYDSQGNRVAPGDVDVEPPFLQLTNRAATFRGRVSVGPEGASQELPVYLYVATMQPESPGQEGQPGQPQSMRADIEQQIRQELSDRFPNADLRADTETHPRNPSFGTPKHFDAIFIQGAGQWPFVVRENPPEARNLDASIRVYIHRDGGADQFGTAPTKKVALVFFGPTDVLTSPDFTTRIAYCLETVSM